MAMEVQSKFLFHTFRSSDLDRRVIHRDSDTSASNYKSLESLSPLDIAIIQRYQLDFLIFSKRTVLEAMNSPSSPWIQKCGGVSHSFGMKRSSSHLHSHSAFAHFLVFRRWSSRIWVDPLFEVGQSHFWLEKGSFNHLLERGSSD